MNNNVNEPKVTQNTEYAGPPKSHDFKDNVTPAPVEPAPAPAQVVSPVQPSQNQINPPPKKTIATAPAQNEELLEIISEPDRKKAQIPPKKNLKLAVDFKSFFSYQKKVKNYVNEHKSELHKFDLFWIITKSIFYFIGLSFFILYLTFYASLDFLATSYLNKSGLSNITFEKIDRSLSEIVFTNIQDTNGLFKIAKIKFSFSFSDLLNKKIQLVEVDSLNINLDSSQTTSKGFQELIGTLWKLGIFDSNSLFAIQSLRLENSLLHIDNKEYELPVNFSGVGSLAEKKQIKFPVKMENQYLSLNGNLLLEVSSSGARWTFDVLSGRLNIPGLEKEALTGKITSKTSHGKVKSIKFSGTFTNDGIDKIVDMDVTLSNKKLFNVNITALIKGKNEVTLGLNLIDIEVDKNFTSFSTNSPLFFKVANFKTENFSSDSIQLSSTGFLKCDSNGCSYRLTKNSNLIIFTPAYNTLDTKLSIVYPLKVFLHPTKYDTVSLKDRRLSFNLGSRQADFKVFKRLSNGDQDNISLFLLNFDLNGFYNFENERWRGEMKLDLRSIKDKTFYLANGKLDINFSDASYTGTLNAEKIQFGKDSYLKLPVRANISFDSNHYFTANFDTYDKWISLTANGYFNPDTREVLMAMQTNKPIVFKKGSPLPTEVSSLFSPQIKNASGKISLKGEVHYSNARSISGPLQILLDDVSFDYGNMQIKELNSLMNLTQIVPLGTQSAQDIYAQSIKATLPFNDVKARIFFDASKKQFNVSSMDAKLAGYSLKADPMWYAYGAELYNLSLRGKTASIQPILDHTTLKDLQITANGSINVTGKIEDDLFTLKNIELSIPSEGLLQYTPKKYPNTYLEKLKRLDFKRLSIYLNEQKDDFELVFSAENRSKKIKKKTSFRFDVKDDLSKYFLPMPTEPLPAALIEAKENF